MLIINGVKSDENFLVRFDCDLHRESKREWPGRRYRLYSTIREVLLEPERFGLPGK